MNLSQRWTPGGWFRLSSDVWPEALEALRARGPLTEAQVRADVAYLLDRMEHAGQRWPSRRQLAERWGWSKSSVSRWLAAEDPCALQSGTVVGHRWDTAGTPAGQSEAVETGEPADDGTPVGQSWDTGGTVVGIRALGTDTDTDTDTDQTTVGQLALTQPPASKSDPWQLLLEHLTQYRPSAARWDRKKNNGSALATLLKRHGLEDAKRVVTLAYTSADLAYLRKRRSDGAQKHPDVTTMYRHGGKWLEDCEDVAITRGDLPSWEQLCQWYDSGKPPGPERDRVRAMGWEVWCARLDPMMRHRHAQTYAQEAGA